MFIFRRVVTVNVMSESKRIIAADMVELSRGIGLVIRLFSHVAIDSMFDEFEKYDPRGTS
jgi:hypothetical protein